MVTLDHSSSRIPAHLFSTLSLLLHLLGLGAGPGEQSQRGEGRLPWTLGEEDAGFPGIAGRGGNRQVRCHSPLRVARSHPNSISLVSPGFWQGWARGNWLPLVCVCVGDPVFNRDSWCHKLLVSSGYRAKADSSSGMRCGAARGPGGW